MSTDLLISSIENSLSEIKSIEDFQSVEDRRNLLRLRKAISVQMVELRETYLTELERKPSEYQEARRRISDVSSAIANLQTRWPAVLLDENTDEYRRISNEVAFDMRALFTWMRAN